MENGIPNIQMHMDGFIQARINFEMRQLTSFVSLGIRLVLFYKNQRLNQ